MNVMLLLFLALVIFSQVLLIPFRANSGTCWKLLQETVWWNNFLAKHKLETIIPSILLKTRVRWNSFAFVEYFAIRYQGIEQNYKDQTTSWKFPCRSFLMMTLGRKIGCTGPTKMKVPQSRTIKHRSPSSLRLSNPQFRNALPPFLLQKEECGLWLQ